ncbi:hypothetical protein GE09DRAFT_13504 [Coniochaeta sp. 2T2.1]|nr:hypothetical protein GE09DRAFT_13504 [Coniochaeta sp. 2T2.1]
MLDSSASGLILQVLTAVAAMNGWNLVVVTPDLSPLRCPTMMLSYPSSPIAHAPYRACSDATHVRSCLGPRSSPAYPDVNTCSAREGCSPWRVDPVDL